MYRSQCLDDSFVSLFAYNNHFLSFLAYHLGFICVQMVFVENSKSLRYAELFNCAVGQWPMKYLGVPVCGSRLHRIGCLLMKNLLKDWEVGRGIHCPLGGG